MQGRKSHYPSYSYKVTYCLSSTTRHYATGLHRLGLIQCKWIINYTSSCGEEQDARGYLA